MAQRPNDPFLDGLFSGIAAVAACAFLISIVAGIFGWDFARFAADIVLEANLAGFMCFVAVILIVRAARTLNGRS